MNFRRPDLGISLAGLCGDVLAVREIELTFVISARFPVGLRRMVQIQYAKGFSRHIAIAFAICCIASSHCKMDISRWGNCSFGLNYGYPNIRLGTGIRLRTNTRRTYMFITLTHTVIGTVPQTTELLYHLAVNSYIL